MGRQSRFEHLSTNTGDALFFFFLPLPYLPVGLGCLAADCLGRLIPIDLPYQSGETRTSIRARQAPAVSSGLMVVGDVTAQKILRDGCLAAKQAPVWRESCCGWQCRDLSGPSHH